jgi:hypothetical protein
MTSQRKKRNIRKRRYLEQEACKAADRAWQVRRAQLRAEAANDDMAKHERGYRLGLLVRNGLIGLFLLAMLAVSVWLIISGLRGAADGT